MAFRRRQHLVRTTLISHRPSAETLGVLWTRRSKVRILPRQPATPRGAVQDLPTTTSGVLVRTEQGLDSKMATADATTPGAHLVRRRQGGSEPAGGKTGGGASVQTDARLSRRLRRARVTVDVP